MSDSFTGQQINASIIRLTAAQWTAQPYVLPAGVIGLESDTGAFKIGDGETAWADLLAYSTPTGVKTYRALLTQTGTDAPVATVLENTLGGTVVWTRNIAGNYRGTLTGAFLTDKTMVATANNDNGGHGGAIDYTLYQTIVTTNFIIVASANLNLAGGTVDLADDLLTDYPIQILVYP